MITWIAPIALVLLVVPVILWWLHRREPRPVVVTVPSLLFLEAEAPNVERPERRRIDRDLLLAIGAAGALAMAAAGPLLGGTRDGRRITVLVDASPAMAARSADGTSSSARALVVAAEVERRARGNDRFERVNASGDELARRLREAAGGLRVVVSDRRPRDLPAGVSFVGVGDPAAVNAGIVSIDVDVVAGRRRVSATIWNDAATPRTLRAGPVGAETDVHCPAFGAVRASWDIGRDIGRDIGPLPRDGVSSPSAIRVFDEGGALVIDDEVTLDPSPIRVAFARDGLSPAVESATRGALDAIFVSAWTEDPAADGGLFVGPAEEAPRGARLVLEVGRVPAGVEPARPGAQDVVVPADAELASDLDLAAADWLYPPGREAHAPWSRITRKLVAPTILVRWHADPSLGRRAAIDTPLWPLFIENVTRLVGGVPGPAGRRWNGVLDRDVTRLGRDVDPIDESALASAPRDVIARGSALGPWFAGVGAICLAVLWCRPRRGVASPVR